MYITDVSIWLDSFVARDSNFKFIFRIPCHTYIHGKNYEEIVVICLSCTRITIGSVTESDGATCATQCTRRTTRRAVRIALCHRIIHKMPRRTCQLAHSAYYGTEICWRSGVGSSTCSRCRDKPGKLDEKTSVPYVLVVSDELEKHPCSTNSTVTFTYVRHSTV